MHQSEDSIVYVATVVNVKTVAKVLYCLLLSLIVNWGINSKESLQWNMLLTLK